MSSTQEVRPDLAPEIEVENSKGTMAHPLTGKPDTGCQVTTYTFKHKGEIMSRVVHWRFEDGFELEQVSSFYSDGDNIRRIYDALDDQSMRQRMRVWEEGYDAAVKNTNKKKWWER